MGSPLGLVSIVVSINEKIDEVKMGSQTSEERSHHTQKGASCKLSCLLAGARQFLPAFCLCQHAKAGVSLFHTVPVLPAWARSHRRTPGEGRKDCARRALSSAPKFLASSCLATCHGPKKICPAMSTPAGRWLALSWPCALVCMHWFSLDALSKQAS